MSTTAFATTVCRTLILGALALAGCQGDGVSESGAMREAPGNWASYENKRVKLEGSAANSAAGPFIRLNDGARLQVVGLRVWPIDYTARPVGVEGTIVKGTDAFADRYVLKVEKYYRVKTDQQPITLAPPEPEKQDLPKKKAKKKD